ncbi:DUF1501 domain-containing protein [Aureibaculum sp. 2210JD6-5]|uniref:DUF1501 domain-containing protein n=1 Tax=Aureibaculum sp. 2210JD6-5 TaxID=3103957 RepID=UPI002AAE658E|nr:DUF1501 domain-containing protein [Aureibaculum sp. 2210JD6-5]MDY7396812.1 DUF1501 domain-containing protein [Aureibaculum sp. 2210JD6-5]
MNRRNFLSITGTFTGGTLLMPNFLHAFGLQQGTSTANQCLVFIQLNGGNDGLNTFIPYDDPLYYELRPKIALAKDTIIGKSNGMGLHPALEGLAEIQQKGDLSIVQNVGYPNPNRSHFRSQEIWQTASASNQYLNDGWLGRYLDLQCKDHQPTAGINIDTIDNLALKGKVPNSITIKNPYQFKTRKNDYTEKTLTDNPQLDFVMKVAQTVTEGSEEIQKAMAKSKEDVSYPKTKLGTKLKWIAKLIKGDLNSKTYYTTHGGFDTHDNQLPIHHRKLDKLDQAVFSFYKDLKNANLFESTTVVIFSEFGRRVNDNGKGTDHGKAAPMFIIGGNNGNGKITGKNPNLSNLDKGDLMYEIDFRSVYASLLKNKLNFDPTKIGITNKPLANLF